MIIDSSAIIAVLFVESDSKIFAKAMETTAPKRLSAASYLECAARIDASNNPVVSRRLDEFITVAQIKIEPVTPEQARLAREANRDFGKGSGHKARLNFGDCFVYALAKAYNEPLLFKGNDFSKTDIRSALK